jgi:alkyl-hydroperoxide reductase/thiol specific antioxidant family protein
MAKSFAEHYKFPDSVAMLTDPSRESYKAAGLQRSILRTFSFKALGYFWAARKKGFRQGRVQGDAFQQGGSLVVDRGGRVLYRFVSDAPGHHASPETLLRHLP